MLAFAHLLNCNFHYLHLIIFFVVVHYFYLNNTKYWIRFFLLKIEGLVLLHSKGADIHFIFSEIWIFYYRWKYICFHLFSIQSQECHCHSHPYDVVLSKKNVFLRLKWIIFFFSNIPMTMYIEITKFQYKDEKCVFEA